MSGQVPTIGGASLAVTPGVIPAAEAVEGGGCVEGRPVRPRPPSPARHPRPRPLPRAKLRPRLLAPSRRSMLGASGRD
jgi:hypothetical protein